MHHSPAPCLFRSAVAALACAAIFLCALSSAVPQENKDKSVPHKAQPGQGKASSLSPQEELQKAIDDASNDRAALVRNLEAYLQKYPQTQQRPQIYRALVEANIQLQDTSRAADYAERIVALTPDDISITLLAIQLLERGSDQAALRRAVNYATRVIELVQRTPEADKSPRVSPAEWEFEKKRERMSLFTLRGRLELKLHDSPAAQNDFESSYALVPTATAAERLGELAELNKDWNRAITEYGRAFVLADTEKGDSGRRELRQKLGNVWKLAHRSEEGLGDFLLRTFDEANSPAAAAQQKRNISAKLPYEFILRRAPDETPYPLAPFKGTILVIDFWATWCGPCRVLEPHFDRVAGEFQQSRNILFLAANCDEDETLVPPYLQEVKPQVPVVYADGFNRLLGVNTFPTLIILDGTGKIAYRSDGFDPDTVEHDLSDAIRRTAASQTANE